MSKGKTIQAKLTVLTNDCTWKRVLALLILFVNAFFSILFLIIFISDKKCTTVHLLKMEAHKGL